MIELLAIAALTFKTRKGNMIMTTKTSIAHKPSQAVIDSATQKAVPMVQAYTLLGGKKSPYTTLTKDRKAFSAWIIAAGMVGDYVTISAKGLPTKTRKKPQYGLFRMLVGSTAWNYWNGKSERMNHEAAYTDDDGKKHPAIAEFTQAGLNEIQARLAGNSKGYDTDLELVNQFADAMRKGGTVKHENNVYKLDSPIAAMKV